MRAGGANCTGSRCPSTPIRSGTAICPTRVRACSTATASTDRTSPQNGHRFNANKLLIDPYAKAMAGTLQWSDARFRLSHRLAARRPFVRPARQRRRHAQVRWSSIRLSRGATTRPPTRRGANYRLRTHVRGFTMQPPARAGAIARHFPALVSPHVMEYLAAAGHHGRRTACPFTAFLDERYLVERRLRNYWGYSPIAFFAPHAALPARRRLGEFKTMVSQLHDAGIEVILDVVYNHTAEGNELGPTLSFRGIDNKSYYRLMPTTALLHRLHRLRQHPQRRPPARPANGDRLAALLGHRHARRRISLRSRAGAARERRRLRPSSALPQGHRGKIRFCRASN